MVYLCHSVICCACISCAGAPFVLCFMNGRTRMTQYTWFASRQACSLPVPWHHVLMRTSSDGYFVSSVCWTSVLMAHTWMIVTKRSLHVLDIAYVAQLSSLMSHKQVLYRCCVWLSFSNFGLLCIHVLASSACVDCTTGTQPLTCT